jgi:dynein heavy chain
MTLLNDLKARAPVDYNIIAIEEKIGDRTPFIVVCLQECERMNELLTEIKVSLENLRLGLTGALNITEAMEFLQTSL